MIRKNRVKTRFFSLKSQTIKYTQLRYNIQFSHVFCAIKHVHRQIGILKGMGGESSRELSSDDLDELKKNTKFKPDEIKAWYDKFHTDFPNGVITEPEFIKMYSKMFPKGDARKFAKHVFRAYDADGKICKLRTNLRY